jgi:CheY-like chemotaxis protein
MRERPEVDLSRDDRYEPDGVEEQEWDDGLPTLTLLGVVRVLRRLGFVRTRVHAPPTGAWIVLSRADRVLTLSLRDADTVLEAGVVLELLSAAGVERRAFIEAADEAARSGVRPSPRRRSEKLVLVVEDNRDSRDLYVELLCQLGFRVLAAADGQVGLDAALASRPDLIVSDISMPHMDGCEMVQRLRTDERTRHVPVIGVTGFGRVWHDAALASGCDVVLAKPTPPEEFEAAVASVAASRILGEAGRQEPTLRRPLDRG